MFNLKSQISNVKLLMALIVAIVAAIVFLAAGTILSIKALSEDEVKQGMLGHVVFYLYIFSVASIAFGSLAGLKGMLWNVFIIISLGWIILGRLLTLGRKFRAVTFLHLGMGSLNLVWVIIYCLIVFI